ncbi:biosynthetic-type acetolactate synthase large subunit [Romboutsia sp.]|uniref:biosynthetic-type acetolactate synthase large subunit n=1 Tax=Romboutsia sp. TaxID=1965302 RepID=UPI003F6627A7
MKRVKYMNGASLLLECLKKEKVEMIFGYPGGANIPLYDALYDYEEDFNHIRTAHEQGLIHAADGYARSTNKVGVCFTTSGPGATNAVTGIATAFMDSTPMVIITAQVPRSLLGKDSFQEIDITGVTFPITKHSYLVRKVEDIPNVVKEAFKVANSGRKGPVLVDIPKDVFLTDITYNVDDYIPYEIKSEEKNIDNSEIKKIINLINKSKKPIIYAGGGVKSSNTENLLNEFATKIDTPIVNSLMGLSSIDRDHELSMGMVGMHGSQESNLAISNCDLLIGIGVRFSDRVISKSSEFAKNADIVHIDIDKSEVNKNINTDVSIIGDIGETLNLLIDGLNNKNNYKWKEEIKYFENLKEIPEEEFHPQNILREVNKKLGEETILVTDVGQHQMWAAKYWNFKTGKKFITSAGLGTMGFGLGAAIGAKVANQEKTVILVTGDGSFRMNCNELATVSAYNIPVVILLLNNGSLGMVRQWQKLFSGKRYSQTDIQDNVDYIKLGNAYNIEGYMASTMIELKTALEKININKPVILQCNINKDYDVYPIVPPNDKLENLICD